MLNVTSAKEFYLDWRMLCDRKSVLVHLTGNGQFKQDLLTV